MKFQKDTSEGSVRKLGGRGTSREIEKLLVPYSAAGREGEVGSTRELVKLSLTLTQLNGWLFIKLVENSFEN